MITRDSIILTLAIFLSAHTAVASPPPTPAVMESLCKSTTADGLSGWKSSLPDNKPVKTFYHDNQQKDDGTGFSQDVQFTIVKEGVNITILSINRLSNVSNTSKEEAESHINLFKAMVAIESGTFFNASEGVEHNDSLVTSDEYTTCTVFPDFRFDVEGGQLAEIMNYFCKTTMPHAEYMKWLKIGSKK